LIHDLTHTRQGSELWR